MLGGLLFLGNTKPNCKVPDCRMNRTDSSWYHQGAQPMHLALLPGPLGLSWTGEAPVREPQPSSLWRLAGICLALYFPTFSHHKSWGLPFYPSPVSHLPASLCLCLPSAPQPAPPPLPPLTPLLSLFSSPFLALPPLPALSPFLFSLPLSLFSLPSLPPFAPFPLSFSLPHLLPLFPPSFLSLPLSHPHSFTVQCSHMCLLLFDHP